MRRIVLATQVTRRAGDPAEVGADGISAEGDAEQFKCAFLPLEWRAINPPSDLVLAEGCRDDRSRREKCLGGPERSEASVAVGIQIMVQMLYISDTSFGAFAAAGAKLIGSNAALGSGKTDLEPA